MTTCILDEYVYLNDYSVTPRYQQLASSILTAVEQKVLQPGDALPSINEVCFNYDISKGTVTKAYKELQQKGVIISSPGKPSRIAQKQCNPRMPVLLLLQSVCERKQQWMTAFLAAMEGKAAVETVIADCSLTDLQDLLERKGHYYQYCVVWLEEQPGARFYQWTQNTPLKHKLVLVQRRELPEAATCFASMSCYAQHGFCDALSKLASRLKKYHAISFLQTDECPAEQEFISCLQRFCERNGLSFSATCSDRRGVSKGRVYFCQTETDLVELVANVNDAGLRLGEDVGVVSLFETPLLRFMSKGITTLSADYLKTGETLAGMILARKGGRLTVPYQVEIRASL